MKTEYQVLFQRECEEKEGKWLNGGMCYSNKSTFKTLEEAEKCRDKIIEKENHKGGTITVNGIGITVEDYEEDNDRLGLKLKRVVIKKRQVTEWEEV